MICFRRRKIEVILENNAIVASLMFNKCMQSLKMRIIYGPHFHALGSRGMPPVPQTILMSV